MKITKISLATIVALGALSSSAYASGTQLEEAIKDVSVSGFARYRYTREGDTTDKDAKLPGKHEFKIITGFRAALSDNFYGVLQFKFLSKDQSAEVNKAKNSFTSIDKTDNKGEVYIYQAYGGYKLNNTEIAAGKQLVGTYFTDEVIGTGIKASNSDIIGLKLSAYAFDALDDNISGLSKYTDKTTQADAYYKDVNENNKNYNLGNYFAIGAEGSYDPINFQLWYGSLTNAVDLFAGEVSASFKIDENTELGAKVAAASSNIDNNFKTAAEKAVPEVKLDDAKFFNAELNANIYGLGLAAGYINWSVDNNNKSFLTLEDAGSFTAPGENFDSVLDYRNVEGKGKALYVTADYKFKKYSVGLSFAKANKDFNNEKTNFNETVFKAGYKYSDKLKFSGFYAFNNTKVESKNNTKNDKFRFEAKYSF